MSGLNSLKLSRRFSVLIAVFILGFAVYGGWSFKTLSDLKVNGPLYQRIVQGKDLVADILPPPEYILESYLVTLQLASEADKTEQDKLVSKLKALQQEYDTRHEFWKKEALDGELNNAFLKQAHDPAVAFYRQAFDALVPAVSTGDKVAVTTAMSRLKAAYETHRKAIDRVVEITNKRNASDEAGAKDRIATATLLLLAILGLSIAVGITVAISIIRGLLSSLGGEPKDVTESMRKIASGDLGVEIVLKEDDTNSLMFSLRQMQIKLVNITSAIKDNAYTLTDQVLDFDGVAKSYAETKSEADLFDLHRVVKKLGKTADILGKSIARFKL